MSEQTESVTTTDHSHKDEKPAVLLPSFALLSLSIILMFVVFFLVAIWNHQGGL